MSHSPHSRAGQPDGPQRTYYHPDDGFRAAGSLVHGGAGAAALGSVRPARERLPASKGLYVPVRTKFAIAVAVATLWAAASLHFAQVWLGELAGHIGLPIAGLAIFGVAIIPGFMNAFLLASLALDRRPRRRPLTRYPALSILIAAYNEESTIVDTIRSIVRQDYPGNFEVIVINDGSKDTTAARVRGELAHYPWLKLIDLERNGGKARALNEGLAQAKYRLIVTVDADSYLFRGALQSIVERYVQDPPGTRVVAGTVLVRNSRASWITKAQEWDYFHGIAAIKRVQSLFHGTMVAQGAFSLYDRATVVAAGGWPDCVGEDIVLTWAILKAGHRVGHCEDACLFTNAPVTLGQFSRQRQRWSRGMVEAFKQHPDILLTPRLSTLFVYWNLLFPVLDLTFTVFFIPGLVLALFGCYWIVGPMTLALIPMGMGMNYFMFSVGRKMFDERGLRVRRNLKGFLIYCLAYSMIMQPICVLGYFAEILNLRKTWGTK
jgi:biofilm PGA synthesis N-glycosyltransferase PgaC